MTIAICDDDQKICRLFEQKIKNIYRHAAVKSFANADELWMYARQSPKQAPDILLLDIQMRCMNGMELARRIRNIGWKTVVIFVTAYADYVFDAFDVGAFHYLIKPVSDKKLKEVLHNAVQQCQWQKTDEKNGDADSADEKRITVKSGSVHTTVKTADIVYAEVFNRKVVLHTTTETIEYYGKLKNLADELGDDFYRPHRAYLVNLRHVIKYDRNVIFLQGGQAAISKSNYTGFVKAYMAYMKRTCGEHD